ncbi:MAG TPA: glycosyltransferase [Chthoniobacterales bacterium]
MKPLPICIAGAHRSGTSMLTRLLHRCGLALGSESDMMRAAADNPDGFWENIRFVQLNDQILNAVGAAWDLPPPSGERFEGANFSPLDAKAELLLASFNSDLTWGWKDPRNCLALPFWERMTGGLRTVIIVRNPLEAAYSMRRRNGTSYALGLRLWEIYHQRLLAHTQPESRVITYYQTFFDQPEEELQKLVAFTGLPADEIAAAASLVSHDRRHTTFTTEQLIDAGASRELLELYNSLLTEAALTQGPLARRKDGKQQVTPELVPDPLAGSANTLNLAVPEAETSRRELARRRGDEIEHREKVAQLQAHIESLRQELAVKSERLALELGRRDGRITELQTAYKHLDELLLREQEGRNKLIAQIETNRQESSERFAQTNRLLQSYSIQLADRESEAGSLAERLRTELGEMRRLIRFLNDVEAAAERLRTSRRWILANPFTWLLAKLRGKRWRGFGHLERVVAKFQAWRASRPSIEELEKDIAGLKGRGASPSVKRSTKTSAETAAKVEFKPAVPTKPIQFSAVLEPEVSIIIPVFNQFDFTLACLASLQDHATDIPFEVILVDDCSTDVTAKELSQIPGLIYLRNDTNSGFIASCNSGAARARGRYLVFLNNDTVVRPGWLGELHNTFEYEPAAGLVGSKLIYPDGRLQEAGGIIWQDGSGWNRGKFQDPGKPEYNYLREVDYCSAASVIVPRELFQQLGGFDSKYAPAYYEDTDLAFKINAEGHKVLYQPTSVAVHYEGITGGTDISAGVKKHQEINRATFTETWAETLSRKPVSGDLESYESLPANRKHILIIDHHLPFADRDSGSLRMSQILSILWHLGHRVIFVPDNLADIPPYGDELRKRGIEVIHHPYLKSISEYLQTNGSKFDVVILSRRDFARKHIEDVRRYAPQARLIFDTVDLHYLREEREAELTRSFSRRTRASEMRALENKLIQEADETWVVSEIELELLRADFPSKSIEVVSNIVPVDESPLPFAGRRDLLFIGSFLHDPNIDAVIYFVRDIFPRVAAALGDVKFYIIGDKAPPEVVALADERVILAGHQPNLRPYFDGIKVSVAPLRYGAGVKGKINQSMGLGVPVVATSIAAEGMSLQPGKDIMVADDPAEFADAIVQLYSSEHDWATLSYNGREKTRALFSVATARKQLQRLFSDESFAKPAAAVSRVSRKDTAQPVPS